MTCTIGLAACVFRSPEILTVARAAGFDFLMVDMEHGSASLAEVANLCLVGQEAKFPVHVRVPSAGSNDLTRVADCGASGIIVPHVDDAETARAIVDRLRFPPLGRRSIPSPVLVTGFRPVPVAELVCASEKALRITAMIESAEGLADVEAIAATPGIDAIMVGPNDLAQSLGRSGDIDHPEVRQAFDTIARATLAAGKTFAVIGLPLDRVRSHALDLGATMVVAANEINLLFDAAAERLDRMRDLTRR